MHESPSIADSRSYPLKVMSLVLLIVFVIEGLIMAVLPSVSPWAPGSLAESIADASLLSAALAPALWFIIVRPLRRVFQERGELLRRLFETEEAERRSLARDLHDELGQHLTAMLVGLRSLQNCDASPQVQERAGDLLRLASESINEVRRLASGLRVGVLDDFGLQVAIERLCEDFCDAHGVLPELDVKIPKQRRFGSEVETALYRITQESLTNIARHARATQVQISLLECGENLNLSIRDNGLGSIEAMPHSLRGTVQSMGVRSMRERVELLGGSFKIESGAGRGTYIEASVPIGPAALARTE